MAPSVSPKAMRRRRSISKEPRSRAPSISGSPKEADASQHDDVFTGAFNARFEDGRRDPAGVRAALDWWLSNLPISGFELAPELDIGDDENRVLFETFARGKLTTCNRNQVVQEDGEEVKHFSIILFGQCRLRCARPVAGAAPIVPAVDCSKDDAKGSDADAFINIETRGRGESLGLVPGPRSPYNILCTEKTTLLRLSKDDYHATFEKFHKKLAEEAIDFLLKHNICPQASPDQLKKIAPFLRQRRIRRGQTFIHSGEYQRHLYLLRSGSCSVLVHDAPDGLGGIAPRDEEEDEDDEEEVDKHDKFLQMRASSYGAKMQQVAAHDNMRNAIVKSMARGPLRKQLAGGPRPHAFRTSDKDLHPTATLSEPGLMLGEEAFVHDNFRDWVNLRSCYSVRAAQNCKFYVADISAFKLFTSYMGSGELTQMVSDKLQRRCKQFTRGQNVTSTLNRRAQATKAHELAKHSRQQLRLPRCAGYPAVDELEDVEDYLDIIFEHRKPPPNTQLPSLTCLEGTVYGPKHSANGPGVSAMLKAVAEDGIENGIERAAIRKSISRDWRDGSSYDENPLGGTVCSDARYAETAPPTGISALLAICGSATASLALKDSEQSPPNAMTRGQSLPELSVSWGGVFLNTEVDFDDGMTVSLQSQPIPHSSFVIDISADRDKVPALVKPVPNIKKITTSSSLPNIVSPHHEEADSLSKAKRPDARSEATKRNQRVVKTFNKVMIGKTVLVLTDKIDLKKQITRTLFSDDTSVIFIKTSNDLWQKLRETKVQYDALLIDLTKNELQIEPMLRTVRQQEKYCNLPIVVLSSERELPDVVTRVCSFVVYLPLAAAMLREALVWCFDRKSVQKLYHAAKPQELHVVMGKSSLNNPPAASSSENTFAASLRDELAMNTAVLA